MWGCSDFIRPKQPAQPSQLVTVVCGNCLINHTPEDHIITGLTTSDSTNLADVVSISDGESSIGEPIYFTNDDENAGLPVIQEVAYSD